MPRVRQQDLPSRCNYYPRRGLLPYLRQMRGMRTGFRWQRHGPGTPQRPLSQALLQILLRQGLWYLRPQHYGNGGHRPRTTNPLTRPVRSTRF